MTRKPLQIAVLGSCQAVGFAACLEQLVPDSKVTAFPVTMRKSAAIPEIERRLPSFDLVFTQSLKQKFFGPLRTQRLRKTIPVSLYPHIAFSGFHPDACIFAFNGAAVPSPTWNFHSAIILGAFACGIPERQVPDLFNAYVYAVLGFYEEYERAKEFVVRKGRNEGYELAPHIAKWGERGVFMHIVNHPKIDVLAELAHLAATQTKLVDGESRPPEGVPDRLARRETWPVYPELAKRLGVPGSLTFSGRKEKFLGRKATREMHIDEVVAESYRIYQTLPEGAFQQPRIETIVSLLRAA